MSPPFLDYLNAGLSVIPVRADGSKAPAIPWREFIDRRPTLLEASAWAESHEGLAVIAGKVSGNLEVIDVDEPTIVRPYLEAVKAQDAGLYERLCLVRTPRRNASGQSGCHAIYRSSELVTGNCKLAMTEPELQNDAAGKPIIDPVTKHQKTAPRTLIETRGEGGYVLAVGCSSRCHPSGNRYEYAHGPRLTDLEVLSPAERNTLHLIARTFDRSVADVHTEPPLRGWERKPGDSPGDAFNARATWPEILGPHGWLCVGEHGGIKQWRRPGKASGISATTGVLSKSGNELFTVFSTNAHPFEGINANGRPGVCYSKFAAYAILHHAGDYEAAAKELLKLGYGTPAKKTESQARVLRETAENAERRYLQSIMANGNALISLGIPALDHAIGGGVEAGEMIVIGGLTSHGKSVCALQAARATVENGLHVVLVSHEMGAMSLAKRLLQARTRWDTGKWLDHVEQLAADSRSYWSGCGKMFVLEQCRHIDAIEKEIGLISAEFTLGMIIIDHAQLTDGRGKSRYEALTDASGRFKQLAVKHNCPLVVPSQLNREAAKGDEAEAHHLRESGALEQDADVVILVRWPWKATPDKESDPKRYLLKIVKNRNRPIVEWQVEAQFNPARQTIESKAVAQSHPEFTEYGDADFDDGHGDAWEPQ